MGGGRPWPRVDIRMRSMPGSRRADGSPKEPRTGSSQTRTSVPNSLVKISVELKAGFTPAVPQSLPKRLPAWPRRGVGSAAGDICPPPPRFLSIDAVVPQAVQADVREVGEAVVL